MTDVPDDLVITISDVRRAGYCVAGARGWFAQQGLDFRDFIRNGLPASRMMETDELGKGVVRLKMERDRG